MIMDHGNSHIDYLIAIGNVLINQYSFVKLRRLSNYFQREIIVYSRSTRNAYSLLLHEWWVLLIKFMVEPIIYVRGKSTHLWYSENT